MKRHLLGALLLLGLLIAACTPGGGAGAPTATAGDNSTPAATDPYDY
jgi:hypothetical protein